MRLVIYGQGYIGNAFAQAFSGSVLSEKDITEKRNIEEDCEEYQPDAILNCAGKTSLEWCRDNKEEAFLVNAVAPALIQGVAARRNIWFAHLSSGCMFERGGPDGKGFTEKDAPRPACFYSKTKVWGDALLGVSGYKKTLILRIRQPFSALPHPRNLITKVLSYDRLITSQNSMTALPDLILATKLLLKKNAHGIFNVCNKGTLSPYDIAEMAKEIFGITKEYIPITKEELDEQDQRQGREKRVDAVLSMEKLRRMGIVMPHVRDRMRKTLEEYAKYKTT